jgi:hypothetical protein
MNGGDPETKRRQAIGNFPRRQAKRGHHDTNGARKQEEVGETHTVGHKPPHEAEPVDIGIMQEEEDIGPALPYRADFVNNVEMKNIEEVQQPPHKVEHERESDGDSNLSALFQDRVERGITVRVQVPTEATGTFIGEYSTTINTIRDSTRYTEMNLEAYTGADHSSVTMLVPDMDVAQEAENVIRNAVRAHEEGEIAYIKGVITKHIMTRAMEGDETVDILSNMPTGEVAKAILVVRAWYGNARNMQNSKEKHKQISRVRIHTCINEL